MLVYFLHLHPVYQLRFDHYPSVSSWEPPPPNRVDPSWGWKVSPDHAPPPPKILRVVGKERSGSSPSPPSLLEYIWKEVSLYPALLVLVDSAPPAPPPRVYLQNWYQKHFFSKSKQGRCNNSRGRRWEPASLPVIVHLSAQLMTVAGGRELAMWCHQHLPRDYGGRAGGQGVWIKQGWGGGTGRQQTSAVSASRFTRKTLFIIMFGSDPVCHGGFCCFSGGAGGGRGGGQHSSANIRPSPRLQRVQFYIHVWAAAAGAHTEWTMSSPSVVTDWAAGGAGNNEPLPCVSQALIMTTSTPDSSLPLWPTWAETGCKSGPGGRKKKTHVAYLERSCF